MDIKNGCSFVWPVQHDNMPWERSWSWPASHRSESGREDPQWDSSSPGQLSLEAMAVKLTQIAADKDVLQQAHDALLHQVQRLKKQVHSQELRIIDMFNQAKAQDASEARLAQELEIRTGQVKQSICDAVKWQQQFAAQHEELLDAKGQLSDVDSGIHMWQEKVAKLQRRLAQIHAASSAVSSGSD